MLKASSSIISASQIATPITFAGNVTLSTGNLVMSDTKGIDFSATPGTGTSELLADYEEGTWTGTMKGSITDPTVAVTSTGQYTKIGRSVTVFIYFIAKNTTGASGLLSVSGLPFTVNTDSSVQFVGSCQSYNLPVPNKYNVVIALGGTNLLVFQGIADNAGWTEPTISAGTDRFLGITVTYFV